MAEPSAAYSSKLEIIDGQLHELGPVGDWSDVDPQLAGRMFTEVMLTAMDAVGIDAAVLHPWQDPAWVQRMTEDFPERFASVMTLADVDAPGFDDQVARLRGLPGVVGARLIAAWPAEELERLEAGELEPAFASCEQHGLPLFVFISGAPALLAPAAKAHPNLALIVDHLGIQQPPVQPNPTPYSVFPDLLSLAEYPNVAVKLCGLPVFSAEGFPFRDVWPQMEQLLDAFGPERLIWASDIGRFRGRIGFQRYAEAERYAGKHTYAESLGFIKDSDQLTGAEKQLLLGGTLRRLVGWSPATG